MKRIYQIVAVVVALLIPAAVGTPASAAVVCDVGYTGPDSQNLCTSTETYQCTVTNTNTVSITNANNQTVASGTVTVSGNGTGGNSASGSVTNTNGTTFSVTITNSDPLGQAPSVCTATVVVPGTQVPEPTTPTTPEPLRRVQPANSATPAVLPVTSGTSLTAAALLILAIGGAVVSLGSLIRHLRE